MPNTQVDKSAEKRVRQDKKKRAHNRVMKGYVRDMMRQVRTAQNKETALEALPHAYSVLDKASKKGIIHHKTCARLKSRIAVRANKIKASAK
ncbi:30S ribosomal protein S20 [bacterium]|nr:30S ribosomal protein S20 [bacterium]